MIKRTKYKQTVNRLRGYPLVFITGAKGVGKSTVCEELAE